MALAHSEDILPPSVSYPDTDMVSPRSIIPYMSHDKKFCKSSRSSASQIAFLDCPVTEASGGVRRLSPTSCCAALAWSHVAPREREGGLLLWLAAALSLAGVQLVRRLSDGRSKGRSLAG